MKAASISDLRENMKAYLDEVADNQDILIVTRPKKEELVVMTMSRYNALNETAYLMSSQRNAREIRESISALRSGDFVSKQISELEALGSQEISE